MTPSAPLDLPALLDDLERAHAAATPGPWENPYPFTKLIDAPGTTDNMAIVQCDRAADAAAIVAEHNAVPTLIAELRKRDAALRAVAELADQFDQMSGEAAHMAALPFGTEGLAAAARVYARAAREFRAALSPESVQL